MLVAEVDVGDRRDAFPIDRYDSGDLLPEPDGSPKRSRLISSYRVLGHIELGAFRNLRATSSVGEALEIERQPYTRTHQPAGSASPGRSAR